MTTDAIVRVLAFLLMAAAIPIEQIDAGKGPQFRRPLIRERVSMVNDDIKLSCKARGSPRPLVQWFYNGTELEGNVRIKMGRFRVTIKNLRTSDTGAYSCRVSNVHGAIWGNFSVSVLSKDKAYEVETFEDLKGPPTWHRRKIFLAFLARPVTKEAEFNCDARGYPAPTIEWYKDGEQLPEHENKYELNVWNLKVKDLAMIDAGNYTCVVTNSYGSIRWTTRLDVQHRIAMAPVLEALKNQTVLRGENATFACKILMSDSQPLLQWLRHYQVNNSFVNAKGEPYVTILQQSGYLKTIDDPQYLVVHNVTEEDAGWYTCLVANTVGMNYRSSWLTVVREDYQPSVGKEFKGLIGPPTWRRSGVCDDVIAREVNQEVVFNCEARAHPQPDITWFKDGTKIDQQTVERTVTMEGWELGMKDLLTGDAGDYTCVVANRYGSINKTFVLDVQHPIEIAPMANQTVRLGENAVLICKLETGGSHPRLQWLHYRQINVTLRDKFGNVMNVMTDYVGNPKLMGLMTKDVTTIVQQSYEVKTIDEPQYLVLPNVEEKDSGWYTCLVANDVGINYRSAWLSVLPDTPPS